MRTTRHPAATRHRSVPATSTLSEAICQALHTPRITQRASAALMLAALALAAPVAQAQSTDWQGADGGDWYNPALWSPVAPDAATDAYFRSGGGAVINGGAAQARDLFINRGYVQVLNGAVLTTQRGFLNDWMDVRTGSTWNTGSLTVGVSGPNGLLEIHTGGTVNSVNGIIGESAGASGSVEVRDAGSSWTSTSLTVGDAGTGTLNITNSGDVAASLFSIGGQAGGLGFVTVDGAGSTLRSDNPMVVGFLGDGTLTISGGAAVVTGSSIPVFDTEGIRIGDEAGSNGTVIVEGAGSSLTMANDMYLGNRGTGTLIIRNGGFVSDQFGLIGAFDLGGVSAGDGTALVDGDGSTWINTGGLFVGYDGTGTLTISNGGDVISGFSEIASRNLTSRGTVVVDGVGSTWTNDGLTVGQFGTGSLTIRNGGTVSSAGSALGGAVGGVGTALVENVGSQWDTPEMVVGAQGSGALVIRDGGTATSGTGIVGRYNGSPGGPVLGEGTVLVEGTGSSWAITDRLDVGTAGGTVTVRDGAALASGDAVVGNFYSSRFDHISGNDAWVLVDGLGSTWTSTGTITSGLDGNGLITVQNGGTVTSDGVTIGLNARSTEASIVVDGAGSSWNSASTTTVGSAGSGTLTVQNGASMDAGFALMGLEVGSVGKLVVDGVGSSFVANLGMNLGVAGGGNLTVRNGATAQSDFSIVGTDVGSNGTLLVDGAGSSWTDTGDMSVGLAGTGTLTVTNGAAASIDNLFLATDAGSIGALNIGTGGVAGVLNTATVTGGDGTATVNFNHSDDVSTATAFLGSLAFNKLGTGTLLLAGTSDYTGATQVQAGTLMVEGALGNTTTTVFDGATLGGTGSIAGDVIVNDGATIAPGMSPGTLTVGSLLLSSGSILDYELGQAGVIGSGINDLIEINGNLTLDGTMNITDAGGFGAGVYRLMNYGGSFVNNGLDLGALPTGFTTNDLFVQTSIVGQVNLINSAGVSLNFRDGAAGPTDDGIIQGGDGLWVSNDRSWTNPDGSLNGNWNQGFAIFGGAAGTVTVMGEQNFTGMQFMTDGYRLQAGTDGALRADGVTNLRVDPNVTATIATPIVGDATLVKVDEGTLVFEGDFGYTGGLTINGGLLIGDTGNLLGNILNRAQLEFAQADDGTYAGTMTGEGALTKSGAGTLTLTGNNSHSGGTTIEAGTLQVGDGGTTGSLAGDVEIQTDGTLAFNRSDNISFTGVFSGDGALDKFGAGTLWLSGDSSGYAGQGTVHAGGLQVDGSLGGDLDVLAGAMLSGTGTLGSVDNAGTIAPGGAIGTLTMTGDYLHRNGATYRVDIDADGNSDLLDIAGTATIEGGDVQVAGVPGQYGGVTRYTIVDADGGVSGTYDALSDSLLFLDLVLAYDPNHVYLDVLRNDTSFGSLCGTGSFNQCEVAKTLDSFDPLTPPTMDIGKMVAQVTTLDAQGALAAFDRLSGEAHPSLAGIVLEGHALYGQTVTRRMAERREAIGADRLHGGAWVRAYGASSELDGDGNAHGADADLRGVAVGYDAWGSENWLIGASVNAMHLEADFRPGDRGEVDAKNVSLYTSFQGDRAYLDAVASYAWWDNDVTRSIQVGNIDRTATSNYNSHRFATYLEGGWAFNLGERSLLQPMLTLQYDNLASQGFQEHGAQDLDLIGRSDSVERLTVGAGTRWSTTFKRGEWTLEPTVQARWLHSEGDEYAEFDVAFAGAPDQGYRTPEFGWRVRGVTLPQDRGVLGLGLAARNENLDLFVDYDYQSGDGFKAHNLSAGLRYRW